MGLFYWLYVIPLCVVFCYILFLCITTNEVHMTLYDLFMALALIYIPGLNIVACAMCLYLFIFEDSKNIIVMNKRSKSK